MNVAVTTVNPPSLNFKAHSDACPTNSTVGQEDPLEVGLPSVDLLRTIYRDLPISRCNLQMKSVDGNPQTLKITSSPKKHVTLSCGHHWQLEGSQLANHAPVKSGSSRNTSVVRFVTTFRRMALPEMIKKGRADVILELEQRNGVGCKEPSVSFSQRHGWIRNNNRAGPTYATQYVKFTSGAEASILSEKLSMKDATPYSSSGNPNLDHDLLDRSSTANSDPLPFLYLGWSTFGSQFKKVSVNNIPPELFMMLDLGERLPRCRSACNAAELAGHHSVVKGLFEKASSQYSFGARSTLAKSQF